MPNWTFVNGLTGEKIEDADLKLSSALNWARASRATPYQSNYYVNTGAITQEGHGVCGSNHEIGITETLTHGEEAVIARALDEFGEKDPIEVIAFACKRDPPVGIGIPCGNCRDAIQRYTNLEKLVIVNGAELGGEAVVVPGKAFFFDDFKKINYEDEMPVSAVEGGQAIFGLMQAYNIYCNPETTPSLYGAAIVCENGDIFRGSYRGDAAYHSIYPISSAIENFRNGSDDAERLNVKRIVIATADKNFKIPYRDRQHALEFAEAINSLNGKKEPLPVYIFTQGRDNQLDVFKTDTNEWLPLRFSPGHLGLDGKMAEAYKKLKIQ